MITTDPKKLKQNRNKNKATLQNIPPGNGTDPGPAQGIVMYSSTTAMLHTN